MTQIAVGYSHNVALKSDGSLVIWGVNSLGVEYFAVTSNSLGTFTFRPESSDVDTAGAWLLQPFVDGFACDPIEWEVGP